MVTISNNKTMPLKLQRSVTNPSLFTSLNKEPLTVTSSMSALTSPSPLEIDLSLPTTTDLEPSLTGSLDSAMASFIEHRARREWKARQHLRRFRQRYLETIEEDCFSDFSDDDNKENLMSRDVNSNVVKTSRKKKRKTQKKQCSSHSKAAGNDLVPQEKLYFRSSSEDKSSLSTKKSSGRLYFPSPDDSAILSNETFSKQEAAKSHEDYVVDLIKQSAKDSTKVEGSPIVMWSDDKTFLCDHTAMASAWLKTNQTATTTTTTTHQTATTAATTPTTSRSLESKLINSKTLMTFAKSENEVFSPEQLHVISREQIEYSPKPNELVSEVTSANVAEKIEKSGRVNNESRRTVSIADEADQRTALKNISRISGSSRTSLREQTSAGNLVSGAFHSTFSYPLHSTLQQSEQSVLVLSPIAPPGSPVYNSRHLKQSELQPIISKFTTVKHQTNKYVQRDVEINSMDNDGPCRLISSAKKIGRAPGLSLVNKNYGGWSSSERFQSIFEPTSQNYQSVRTSRKLRELYPVSDNHVHYKEWRQSTKSNDCLTTPVHALERRTPMKRSVGCTRIGLHTLQPHTYTAQGDPYALLEASRGSLANLNSFSTDRSSSNGTSFSSVHQHRDSSMESFSTVHQHRGFSPESFSTVNQHRDSSTESFVESRNYMSAESSHLRRRQTHHYLYENSQSTLEEDDDSTRMYCRRQCTPQAYKQRGCCTHRVPSTPQHIYHPPCQRHNTLPDLIRVPSHHKVYHHECVPRRISAAALDPLEQPYHQRYERAGLEQFISDEVSTRLGTVGRNREKRSKTLVGGRKLGCFTRMLCTNSEVTQIFTSDQFE